MTAMRLKRYPSPSGGIALGKMGVGATMLKQGKTARDYVQNGLVAMWDGIENAGWGVHDTHNGMANLVGGSSYGDILGGTIQENGLYTASKISCANSATLNDYMTVEVCFDYANTDHTSKNVFMFPAETTANSVGAYSWNSSIDFRLYRSVNWNNYTPSDANDRLKTTAVIAFRKASGQNLGQMLASYGYGGEYKTIRNDDSWVANYAIPDTGKIYICDGSNLPILVHSVRLYSRALTADEIARNYAIDKARFGLP